VAQYNSDQIGELDSLATLPAAKVSGPAGTACSVSPASQGGCGSSPAPPAAVLPAADAVLWHYCCCLLPAAAEMPSGLPAIPPCPPCPPLADAGDELRVQHAGLWRVRHPRHHCALHRARHLWLPRAAHGLAGAGPSCFCFPCCFLCCFPCYLGPIGFVNPLSTMFSSTAPLCVGSVGIGCATLPRRHSLAVFPLDCAGQIQNLCCS